MSQNTPNQAPDLGTVSAMSPHLFLPSTATDLGDFALDLTGFTVDNVAARVGDRAADGLDREDPLPAMLAARGDDPLGILIRLFLLGGAVSQEELTTGLPRSASQVRQWGIVVGTEEFRAAIDLRPTTIGNADVLLAADLSEIATGEALSADHVLGLGGASATLVDLTIRTPVTRALDMGAGSGIQTLGLRSHAQQVVATDISERALTFAQFNLALNDAVTPADAMAPVELRTGSFFEPVDGDFDLIVSNPPFVVSPRHTSLDTYTYRDGGHVGDGVVQHLIESIPAHLRPGGVGQLLANWEVHKGQEWSTRITQWMENTGCDAWVIQRELVDPAHYVHTWLRDGGLTPERNHKAYTEAYTEWLADFDAREVSHIAFGYITLRKPRSNRAPWIRIEENTGTIATGLGNVVADTLNVVEELAELSDAELLEWVCEVPGDVSEERYYRPGASDPNVILLRQGGGFARAVQVDTLGAAAVGACEGELTLGQICGALGHLLEVDEQRIIDDVLPTIRGLLTDGVVVRADEKEAVT